MEINAKKLRKIYNKVRNTERRKLILIQYKDIKKTLKRLSKRGENILEYDVNVYSFRGQHLLLASRLFKIKNKDFKVKIYPSRPYEKGESFFDVERHKVKITF